MSSKMLRRMSAVVVSVALLVVIGCGGGNENAESDTGKAQVQQQQPAAKPKAALKKGDPIKGKTLYMQSCSACHGADGKGIKGIGKDLVHSEFVKQKTDEELLHYVIVGRPVNDPLNTTGIPMPPKGGNPALTDEQILDIIAYIRTIQE
ncbi:MAG: cytochrome c [Calditrichaeota bacterium]|nr:cytochrome c [Calditrichota bacterium]